MLDSVEDRYEPLVLSYVCTDGSALEVKPEVFLLDHMDWRQVAIDSVVDFPCDNNGIVSSILHALVCCLRRRGRELYTSCADNDLSCVLNV